MKKRTLINPRKVVWVMRDFINEISSVTTTASRQKNAYTGAIDDADAWLGLV